MGTIIALCIVGGFVLATPAIRALRARELARQIARRVRP